jgi:hypothetical protein
VEARKLPTVSASALFAMLGLLRYSFPGISSYDELTEEEKTFCSREQFDEIRTAIKEITWRVSQEP